MYDELVLYLLSGELIHGSHYPYLDNIVDKSIGKFKKGLSQFTDIKSS